MRAGLLLPLGAAVILFVVHLVVHHLFAVHKVCPNICRKNLKKMTL
jgi:hypothetical protein